MAENGVTAARTTSRPRPIITLPPRENLFFDSSTFSPGPMTLVSSLFSDTGCQSFSQLLAGAMASPAAAGGNSFLGFGSVDDKSNNESQGTPEKGSLGFKQNRPVSLSIGAAAASSPLFMIPPGLSPSGFLNSPGFFPSYGQLMSPFGMSHQQALAQVTAQATIAQSSNNQSQLGYRPSSSEPADSFISNSSATTNVTAEHQMQLSTIDANSPVIESSEVGGSDGKYQTTSLAVDKPAADGYNWRKYGQKQVKGSVFPRSYYKCTQIGCPVKKKVERSIEGQIIEIIYKGQHNHELPRSTGRGKDSENSSVKMNTQIKPEINISGDYSVDNKTTCLQTDVFHDSTQPTLELIQLKESEETDDKVDTREDSQCTANEPNPKRRKAIQQAPSQKTVTESRIVVQTRSEVDLLDDGFKWRKYGQKVVKGNPHPRSYYKCTTPGCSVRKHVERAAADPKAVITTYEGKHTHDIPQGRHTHASQLNPVKTAAQQTLPVRN